MIEDLQSRRRLFAAMHRYLSDKSGPIRAERLPALLLGVEYNSLSDTDKRIVCGTLGRCGFEQRPSDWPMWFRKDAEAEAAA